MAQSSAARITKTLARESGLDISRSNRDSLFMLRSTVTPRNSRPLQVAARTSGEFSPTPAVNTENPDLPKQLPFLQWRFANGERKDRKPTSPFHFLGGFRQECHAYRLTGQKYRADPIFCSTCRRSGRHQIHALS